MKSFGSATLSATLSASPEEDKRLAHLWSAWVMRPSGTCRVRYWSYTHQLIIGMLWISHRPDIKACSHPVFGRIQDMVSRISGYRYGRTSGQISSIGLYKKRRETFFYWKNLLLLTVVYCKEIIRVREKCQDVFFFLKS